MSIVAGGKCASLTQKFGPYPDGSFISGVGGLPSNNDGGCHWDDEGTNGNYANSTGPTQQAGSTFVMCGPQWGSWQDSKKPNSHGNKAMPLVSWDGDDATRGTLIPLSGTSPINVDARMRSLCCNGTDYSGANCYRSGSSCDL